MACSAMHVFMMLAIPNAIPTMVILSAFYLGQAISKYHCEKHHDAGYIKNKVVDTILKTDAVNEAEDIVRKGF
jgi:hypothetical protein